MSQSTLAQFQSQANPADWALATQYANQFGIPDNIFHALIAQESSWNPDAQSSNSTSVGYGQLTAGTAHDLGVDPTNPQQNLYGAAKYLSAMYAKFGNWNDALAHYNQGPNATSPTALAAGARYAQSVMSIADTGSVGAAPAAAPADSTGGNTVDNVLTWIKTQLGNFFFLLIGAALIVIALLSNKTVQTGVATVTA